MIGTVSRLRRPSDEGACGRGFSWSRGARSRPAGAEL